MEGKGNGSRVTIKDIADMRQADMGRLCEECFGERGKYEYTAVFCASDLYAIEFMNVLQGWGVKVPEEVMRLTYCGSGNLDI